MKKTILNRLLAVGGVLWAAQAVAQSTSLGHATVTNGNVQINEGAPGQVTVQQGSSKAIVNWSTLNVPQGSGLRFVQPSSQAIILNRVTGAQSTQIHGALSGNGQVWILNPNGVLFGPSSTIHLHGLLASTKGIADADFLQGNYRFNGAAVAGASVSNAGRIEIGSGGYAILAGQRVSNSGVIQADLGRIALGGGEAFGLDLYGDGLLRFDVTQQVGSGALAPLVENTGTLQADGGVVQITARAASDLIGGVVNTSGLIQANSAALVNGAVVIDGGPSATVNVNGAVTTRGEAAGTAGGRITVVGDAINLGGAANIDASGQAGGGTVLVGGEWQGGGTLQQARNVDVASGAEIRANAITSGDGGTVVVWSDATNPNTNTRVAGRIEALGSGIGRGGQIETSGGLLSVSGQVSAGRAGRWLLDPTYLVVDSSNAATIAQNLFDGSDVIVQSSSGGLIQVNDAITVAAGAKTTQVGGSVYANLLLDNATGTGIEINSRISLSEGVSLTANSGGAIIIGAAGVKTGAASPGITTVSGNVALNAGTYLLTGTRLSTDAAAVVTTSGTITTNSDFAVLGQGALHIGGAGGATVLATGSSSTGEAFGLPSGVGIMLYETGNTSILGYTTNYIAGGSTDHIVRLDGAGNVLLNASAGSITAGNYVEGASTFVAFDGLVDGSQNDLNNTGQFGSLVYANNAAASFILAAPTISIPQRNSTNAVYNMSQGTRGILAFNAVPSQVGDLITGSTASFLVGAKFATASRTYDGTTTAAIGIDATGFSQLEDSAGNKTTPAFTGSNGSKSVGSQSVVITQIQSQSGGSTVFSGEIQTNLTQTITAAPLTLTANTDQKVYDATTASSVSPTVAGLVAGETVAAGAAVQNFQAKNVATNITITPTSVVVKDSSGNDVTSNYAVSYVPVSSGVITAASLSVTFQGENKTYDGTKTAFVTPVVTGVQGSDNVAVIYSSARFDDEAIGSGKTVSITGVTVAGVDKDNYTLATTSALTTAAITTPASVVASAVTSVSDAVNVVKDISQPGLTDDKLPQTTTVVATTSKNTVVGSIQDDGKPVAAVRREEPAAVAAAPAAPAGVVTEIRISKPNDPDGKPAQPDATAQPIQLASAAVAPPEAGGNPRLKDMVVISVDRPIGAPVAEVGAATLRPIDTPKAVEDASDPILLSLDSLKASQGLTPNSAVASAVSRAAAATRSLVPVVPGLLVIETAPPKAVTASGDDRLSGSGNRARW